MAVDRGLAENLDPGEASEARQATEPLPGEAPVDEVVAGVDLARFTDLDEPLAPSSCGRATL